MSADDLRTDLTGALSPFIIGDTYYVELAVSAVVDCLVKRWADGELRAEINEAAVNFIEVER